METVILAYAIDEHGKNLIGVYVNAKVAVQMIKKQGFEMNDTHASMLEHLGNTTDLPVNFHLEKWQVHGTKN